MASTKKSSWLCVEQKHLGLVPFFILLVITSLITPLSLDMYTPAIPHMTTHFQTSEFMVNFTLVGYYLVFSIALLIFGPISDNVSVKTTASSPAS